MRALAVDKRESVVTWIHVDDNLNWRCVRLIGDERKTRVIGIEELKDVLEFGNDTKHHLVLVDGWTAAAFNELTTMCSEWFIHKDVVMHRRLAFICSVAARGKAKDDTEILTRAMEYHVWSWTLDEYLAATTDDDFFNDVSPFLDGSEESSRDRSALVKTKYYYAGGSCYMFCFSTIRVMEKLTHAVESLADAATTSTHGQRSFLFAMFKKPSGVGEVTCLISPYAAATIAIKCGPDAIKKFISTRQDSSNPALNMDVRKYSKWRTRDSRCDREPY